MKKRTTMVFAEAWYDALADMPLEDKAQIYEAIFAYTFKGKEADLSASAAVAFRFIRPLLDAQAEKYAQVCSVRSQAGIKGNEKRWSSQDIANANKESQMVAKHRKASQDIANATNININRNINRKENVLTDIREKAEQGSVSESFAKFLAWQKENAPRVGQMQKPITQPEFDKLKAKYSTDAICDAMTKMENWQPLLRKNISAFLTICNWIEKDKDRSKTKQGTPLPTQLMANDEQARRLAAKMRAN